MNIAVKPEAESEAAAAQALPLDRINPGDPRRFFSAGDNQIAGVGDGFERNSPPWIETVQIASARAAASAASSDASAAPCASSMLITAAASPGQSKRRRLAAQ